MSLCGPQPARTSMSTEEARVRAGTAIGLLEVVAQALEELPPPEIAFARGDRDLYRFLLAGQTALGWIVGHGEADSVDHPAPGSALGDGQRIYEWSDEEAEQHFLAAIRAWSERQ